MTDTNTDSVALKKLRNAEYQRKYRAKLTQQQLITLNSSKASTNRNRYNTCLLYTSPSPRDLSTSRMPSSA